MIQLGDDLAQTDLELNALAPDGRAWRDPRTHGSDAPRVQFTRGERYEDFDPELDEVASYGLGALILGKVASKTGLVAIVGAFLLKGWKLLLAGFAALAAFLRRFMGRRRAPTETDDERFDEVSRGVG